MPMFYATDKITLGEHPLLIALHAQGAIVNEKDEIGAFSIPPLKSLDVSFLGGCFAQIAIQTQINSHSASLHNNSGQSCKTGNHVMGHTPCRRKSMSSENEELT